MMSSIDDRNSIYRELLTDFIRAYESQPCLWRVKSSEYNDRRRKHRAYGVLLNKYKLIDSHADKNAVVKKINSLRTIYRKERKKVEASRLSSIDPNDRYESRLWYYHLFQFLENRGTPNKCSSFNLSNNKEAELAKETKEEESIHSTEDLNEFIWKDEPSFPTSQDTLCTLPEEITDQSSLINNKAPHTDERPCIKRCNDTYNDDYVPEEHFKKPKLINEDRIDIFGKNVVLKMKDITNNVQRLLAEKLINDALFMAETDQLTMSHSICDSINSRPTSSMAFLTSQQFNNNNNN